MKCRPFYAGTIAFDIASLKNSTEINERFLRLLKFDPDRR
jgi:hypothetical protein